MATPKLKQRSLLSYSTMHPSSSQLSIPDKSKTTNSGEEFVPEKRKLDVCEGGEPPEKKHKAGSNEEDQHCNSTTPATPLASTVGQITPILAKQKRKLDVCKDDDAAAPPKRKRKRRCRKEKHLCPVCKLDDCNECENCL